MKNGDVLYIYICGWWFQPTPLKNDGLSSSVGMMTFPTVSGNIKAMFQTTDQLLSSIRIPIQSPLFPMKNPKLSAPKKESKGHGKMRINQWN